MQILLKQLLTFTGSVGPFIYLFTFMDALQNA